jgi:hypothetical protein
MAGGGGGGEVPSEGLLEYAQEGAAAIKQASWLTGSCPEASRIGSLRQASRVYMDSRPGILTRLAGLAIVGCVPSALANCCILFKYTIHGVAL